MTNPKAMPVNKKKWAKRCRDCASLRAALQELRLLSGNVPHLLQRLFEVCREHGIDGDMDNLREWAASHPQGDTPVDDSRESIYGDEGR